MRGEFKKAMLAKQILMECFELMFLFAVGFVC